MDTGAPAEAEARRQAAEARRQKILARQKDRLSTITGAYAQSEPAPTAHEAQATPSASATVTSAAADAQTSANQEQQQQRQWQDQQLESLLTATQARLQHVQALLQEPDSSGALGARSGTQGAAARAGVPTHDGAQASGPGTSATTLPSAEAAAVMPYLRLGMSLGVAAARTRPLRLLVAVFLAYALSTGLWDVQSTPLPPVLLVVAAELCLALGGLLLGGAGSQNALQQMSDQLEGMLPRRLQHFDLTALFPGAKEALRGLLGYRQFLNGLSEDVAAYVVACGLLVAIVNHWHPAALHA